MEREVLVESGYRCAMPTCRETTVDLCHIEPWAKVKRHEASNLIALCPVDHRRYDTGQIDRKAIKQIKANLSVLAVRYTELERRILVYFAENPESDFIAIEWTLELLYSGLVRDGFLLPSQVTPTMTMDFTDDVTGELKARVPMGPQPLILTPKGREFVRHWVQADPI
jgi:hypothetical protein